MTPDNNQTLTISLLSDALYGNVGLSPSGSITYSPDPGFNGYDYFTYLLCDDGIPVLCDTALVTIAVGDTDEKPVAVNDTLIVSDGQPNSINVILNDLFPGLSANDMTVSLKNEPQNGTVELTDDHFFTYTPNPGFVGTDNFTYQICTPSGLCDEATVYVQSGAKLNAEPDIVYTINNVPVTFNILSNDTGSGISITNIDTQPKKGNITGYDPLTGEVTYQPTAYALTEETDYFIYTICDDFGDCEQTIVAIVIINEDEPNLAPAANNDIAYTQTETPVTVPVLSNDTDPNNDPLSLTEILTQPENGTATINADDEIVYTPNTGFDNACDELTYIVCDAMELCDTATLAIGIGTEDCINHAPEAEEDIISTKANENVNVFVLDNDTDEDEMDVLTAYTGTKPAYGNLILNDDMSFTYIPDNSYAGNDYFTYIVCDNGQPVLCDTAYVNITVLPKDINAQPDIDYTIKGKQVAVKVLENDEGSDISITLIVSAPENGSVVYIAGNDFIQYIPNPSFVGTDYFEYQICDPQGNCDLTLVTIHVLDNGQNNIAPVAVNDKYNTSLNKKLNFFALYNDFDMYGGDTIIIDNFFPANHGTLELNDQTAEFTYMPDIGYTGIDSFKYMICDNGTPILCDEALVVINVGSEEPTNNPPLAIDDFAIAEMNVPLSIAVLSNDNDPDDDALTVVTITDPLHGQVSTDPNNNIIYTPDANYEGTEYFAYIICDDGIPVLCDTAYVTILVELDTALIEVTTLEDEPKTICMGDYISGFNTETITVLDPPDNGNFLLLNGDCVQYLPENNFTGKDTIFVEICNDDDLCIITEIIVTVEPKDDTPVANDDYANTKMNVPVEIEILDNDFDPDGMGFDGFVIVQGPSVPGADLDPDFINQTITYVPATDYVGVDSFSYYVTQGGIPSDTAWVYVTIDKTTTTTPPGDDLEVDAIDDATVTPFESPIIIYVLTNDDLLPEEDVVSMVITIIDFPDNGLSVLNNDFTITYTPGEGFSGLDTFSYQVCVTLANDSVYCDTAEVVIQVQAEGEPPINPSDSIMVSLSSGFSPNDDGYNEVFLIENIENYQHLSPELIIFNRWGDIVYQRKNYTNTNAWNGRFQNSNEEVPDGTYYYILNFNTDNIKDARRGFIEVVR